VPVVVVVSVPVVLVPMFVSVVVVPVPVPVLVSITAFVPDVFKESALPVLVSPELPQPYVKLKKVNANAAKRITRLIIDCFYYEWIDRKAKRLPFVFLL
jgi:hypothetical protein